MKKLKAFLAGPVFAKVQTPDGNCSYMKLTSQPELNLEKLRTKSSLPQSETSWSVKCGENTVKLMGDDEDTMEYLISTSGSSMLVFTLDACSEQSQRTVGM